MTQTNKFVYALAFGAATSLFVAISANQAMAADTYAEYETQASLGNITQMPGKSAKKAEPRKVNHARYEAMAEKGIFIQPKSDKPSVSELAKRTNHAEYDTINDIDG